MNMHTNAWGYAMLLSPMGTRRLRKHYSVLRRKELAWTRPGRRHMMTRPVSKREARELIRDELAAMASEDSSLAPMVHNDVHLEGIRASCPNPMAIEQAGL